MSNKKINRIKVMLAEKEKTNKWLAEQVGKDPATISKWCTNTAQPINAECLHSLFTPLLMIFSYRVS